MRNAENQKRTPSGRQKWPQKRNFLPEKTPPKKAVRKRPGRHTEGKVGGGSEYHCLERRKTPSLAQKQPKKRGAGKKKGKRIRKRSATMFKSGFCVASGDAGKVVNWKERGERMSSFKEGADHCSKREKSAGRQRRHGIFMWGQATLCMNIKNNRLGRKKKGKNRKTRRGMRGSKRIIKDR